MKHRVADLQHEASALEEGASEEGSQVAELQDQVAELQAQVRMLQKGLSKSPDGEEDEDGGMKAVVEAAVQDNGSEEDGELTQTIEEDEAMEVGDYWDAHKAHGELIGLVNNEYLQQFEVKEDYRLFRTKQYKVKLDQFEDPDTKVEVRKDIGSRVLKVVNDFFTMHAHQTATFKSENGTQVGEYTIYNPHFFNRHWTWRVAKLSDPDNVLFTIQKRLWNDHCKYAGWFKCKPVVKIYVGHVDNSQQEGPLKKYQKKHTLIYYGVGDRDLDEPDFKFYHSVQEYKANKRRWAAKVDHKKTKSNGEDKYKVKVMPGEDAGLLLLAATCLDKVADSSRDDDHYDDHHRRHSD